MKGKFLYICIVGVLVLGCGELEKYQEAMYVQWEEQAQRNLGAIRSTQVAYFAEWSFFVGNQPLTPVAERAGNSKKVPWDGTTRFSILGFAPLEDVRCSYSLGGTDWPTQQEGFTTAAHCDLDEDGEVSTFTMTYRGLAHSGDDH